VGGVLTNSRLANQRLALTSIGWFNPIGMKPITGIALAQIDRFRGGLEQPNCKLNTCRNLI